MFFCENQFIFSCDHTFCDVKYFYFLLSKYFLISGIRPLGGSSWKLLELTSVSGFLAYVREMLWCLGLSARSFLDIFVSYYIWAHWTFWWELSHLFLQRDLSSLMFQDVLKFSTIQIWSNTYYFTSDPLTKSCLGQIH